ncbi:glycosyltransferase family 4 protein [Sulfurimonas sp. SWIR-19]|uniref:glycosyltransferase family 4 protein n=1 Tax=Sulfurimonas sp. SWIR-19 TaxID=2878390 RepID=UPI001CF1DEC4|nr:glycosyltransferase family 4 protein [Sulfurimonas sp. SWIR-19]UCN01062.1 glycosyltransferase family 4 protein [Sulfurimonas sp. SWIR-19]
MKNKNILELCLAHGLGGLEMFVASCYEEFSKKTTCKVVVAPQSKLDNYLEINDKFTLKRNKFFPFIPALQLSKYIDENDIDIVHFHWSKDILTAVLAKILSKKKPKLVQSRHMGMTRFKDDFYHKWLYKNIDMIHAVTLQVKKQLEKFIPAEVRPEVEMVYLGVKAPKTDADKVSELRQKYQLEGAFVVGIVGRIEKGKGQYKVLEAVARLKDANIKAVVVGAFMDDKYAQELQAYVKKLGIQQQVIFTGFTKDVNEHMQLFDVNVLATENETFGLVVIEAMANKIPVIATCKGGPLEIIDEGVDGLLFDGSVDDLGEKIRLLHNDLHVKEGIAQAAFKKVKEKFDYTAQLEKLYGVMK